MPPKVRRATRSWSSQDTAKNPPLRLRRLTLHHRSALKKNELGQEEKKNDGGGVKNTGKKNNKKERKRKCTSEGIMFSCYLFLFN